MRLSITVPITVPLRERLGKARERRKQDGRIPAEATIVRELLEGALAREENAPAAVGATSEAAITNPKESRSDDAAEG